ncbi:hypothetical protein BDR07DRAFT_1400861 [Suillus spraguei]|nr:hypothetical protein BDR07DRAFT_1400861 [Suillus spraguei]
MNQQRLVKTSKEERGEKTPGAPSELNLRKTGVNRVGSGLNRSLIACVQSVSAEMGKMVEEMRVLQLLLVGSANLSDRGQTVGSQEGIVIECYYGVFYLG